MLLYVVTPEIYFLSHRRQIAAAARADGWEVHVATPEGDPDGVIAGMGLVPHRVPLHRAWASPAHELHAVAALVRLYRAVRPDVIHAVSTKTAVVAGMVARAMGIPTVVMKGGLGSTATQPGMANAIARRLIRTGIRAAVGRRAVLVVQNPVERDDLARSAWVRRRTVTVHGAGVDCRAFHPSPEPPPPVTIVLPGRMVKHKGVPEFVAAARILRARGVEARFQLAGEPDPGNTHTVTREQLLAWHREGCVEWLGHQRDMPRVLARSHVVCLPTHGEGLSRALAEAAAAGRPIVTTDAPGGPEVVRHGVNGLLVPVGDPAALAGALERLIRSPETRMAFGRAGREMALARWDERVVHPRILSLYRALLNPAADTTQFSGILSTDPLPADS